MSSSTSSSENDSEYRSEDGAGRPAWIAIVALAMAGVVWAAARTLPHLAVDAEWNRGRAEVLFVGSSHLQAGIHTAKLAPAVGVVSFAGLNVELAESVVRKHHALWPELRTLVLEVDEFTLLTDTVAGIRGDLTHLCDRLGLSFWDLPAASPLEQARRAMDGCSWAGAGPRHRLSLPRLRGRLVGGGGFFEPPQPKRSWADSGIALSERNADKRARFVEELAAAAPGAAARNRAATAALARFASERGWEVALVSLPKHRLYRRHRHAAWDAAIEAAIDAARQAGSADIAYWDLQADPCFEDDAFEDQDHLNATGAASLAPLLDALLAGQVLPAEAASARRAPCTSSSTTATTDAPAQGVYQTGEV